MNAHLPARRTGVLVIGGGLSGTRLAERLHARGTDVLLVEARERLGGRILSLDAHAGDTLARDVDGATAPGPRVELGPSWFWSWQTRLHALVAELGLDDAVFEQASDGLSLAEYADGRIERARGIASMHGSLRLAGGLHRLVDGLARTLPPDVVLLGTRAAHVTRTDGGAITRLVRTRPADASLDREPGGVGGGTAGAESGDALGIDGLDEAFEIASRHVVFALPPRLVAERITFEPALAEDWRARLERIPTWMAGQAKLAAVYASPFWREAGLSGDAVSQCGPLGEIHDASAPDGSAQALFGFVGVPAAARAGRGAALEQSAVAQLARLFGRQAAHPLAVHYKDWAVDPLTATDADGQGRGHPDGAPLPSGPWADTLRFAGAEAAPAETGYLEGALVSAEHVCAALAGTR